MLYLFLDGIYLRLHPDTKRTVAVLCAYGILWNGQKVLLHLAVGEKESTTCWEAFLEDLKASGDARACAGGGGRQRRGAQGAAIHIPADLGATVSGAPTAQRPRQAAGGRARRDQETAPEGVYRRVVYEGTGTGPGP